MVEKLEEKFASENHAGPVDVVDFEDIGDEEEAEIIRRDVYEPVMDGATNMSKPQDSLVRYRFLCYDRPIRKGRYKMWTRAELKTRAKACLKKYYWMAFLVSLIAALLGGGGVGSGSGVKFGQTVQGSGGAAGSDGTADAIGRALSGVTPEVAMGVAAVILVIALAGFVIGTLWGTFMSNVVEVGCCRYFMESRGKQESAGLGRLFWCFEKGKYLNVVKTMFLKNLFVGLWSLLLIVPGIIKSYEYAMVPYILSERPDMHYRDALDLSREMMRGEKWNLFVLQLSFIGWELLGALLCGIGTLFVKPYVNATFAEFYEVMRQKSGEAGKSLPGYGQWQEAPYVDYQVIE